MTDKEEPLQEPLQEPLRGDSVAAPTLFVVPDEPPKRKVAHTIPADWKPNSRHAAFAREKGLDLSTIAFAFRAHAEAKGQTWKDWDAAFRNWLANEVIYAARRGHPSSGPSARDEWNFQTPDQVYAQAVARSRDGRA